MLCGKGRRGITWGNDSNLDSNYWSSIAVVLKAEMKSQERRADEGGGNMSIYTVFSVKMSRYMRKWVSKHIERNGQFSPNKITPEIYATLP